MMKKNYNIIGVMSGTSLDGLDLAYLNFSLNEEWTYKIIKAETVSYSVDWLENLTNLINFSPEKLAVLDKEYTVYLSEIILKFILKHQLKNIDAVCSHGHTALHKPENGVTYQIGNLPELATLLKKTVVCNFRVQDVIFGGQGAPLVPIGDLLLFNNFNACINLGGFSNISKTVNNQRIAFDICPVNIILNHYVSRIGLKYDNKGAIALKGSINQSLLLELNQLEFYSKPHPKSLGLEWVKEIIFPIIDSYCLKLEDILCTVVEHIAYQISLQIKSLTTVLFTGGGVYNSFLMARIKHFTTAEIIIPDNKLIEFKEALIFGFLGVLKLRNENNCLASVTGAVKNHSSGNIFY